MKRFILVWTLLAWTVVLSFSQNTYPKQAVINKDTVVLILPIQLRETNKIFLERDMLDSILEVKVEKLIDYKKMTGEKDTLLSICRVQREFFKVEKEYYESRYFKEKEKTERVKKQRNIAIGSGGGLLILLILALL